MKLMSILTPVGNVDFIGKSIISDDKEWLHFEKQDGHKLKFQKKHVIMIGYSPKENAKKVADIRKGMQEKVLPKPEANG
jgi:hypothetical protein